MIYKFTVIVTATVIVDCQVDITSIHFLIFYSDHVSSTEIYSYRKLPELDSQTITRERESYRQILTRLALLPELELQTDTRPRTQPKC